MLERVDAPDELVTSVRDTLADLDQAWEACDRGAHRVWLAAVAGAPIEVMIEAGAAAVTALLERLPEPPEAAVVALERAVGGATTVDLLAAAEACEALADAGSYRGTSAPARAAAARAAALVARAAEGLAAGEARREATRLEQAQRTGAFVGVGTHAVLPADPGPARLDVAHGPADPAQGTFLYAVAAVAEAVAEVAAALGDEPATDALVRAALEA